MNRMRELLLEGLSDVLYHVTPLKGGLAILGTNRFRLTPSTKDPLSGTNLSNVKLDRDSAYAKEFQLSGRKLYFGSFARSARSKYGLYKNDENSRVLFVLDGRRLGQRYKGRAVNWFSGHDDEGGNFDSGWKQEWDEMEDRIVSDKPYIEGFSKYVKEVRVIIEIDRRDGLIHFLDSSYLRKILILGKKLGVPIRVWPHTDWNSYILGKRGSELTQKEIIDLLSRQTPWWKVNQSNSNRILPEDALLMGALVEFFEGRSDGRKLVKLISKRKEWSSRTNAIDWMARNITKDMWSRWQVRVLKLVRDRWGGNFTNFVQDMKGKVLQIK